MYIVYKVLLVPQDAKSLFIVVHQPLHKQPKQLHGNSYFEPFDNSLAPIDR